MKPIMLFFSFASLVLAVPPVPPGQPPPIPSAPGESPLPIPGAPSSPSPLPWPPVSPPPGGGSPTTIPGPAQPTITGDGSRPVCECGYTYCASVLMAMKKPWTIPQLAQAYCSTPSAKCMNNVPSTNVTDALYLCLCDGPHARVGNTLGLLCGCDRCLVVGPDFRGRCEKPCSSG